MNSATCVITGATSGIGRAAAIDLARAGFRQLLLGRNVRRGNTLASKLARKSPKTEVQFFPIDLSSLASVRTAAAAILREHPRIDLLINNAGARFDGYQESPDGLEATFATNHLGHFLLTALLLDALLKSPASRIINVSSSAHLAARRPDHWLIRRDEFDRRQAYARSKLANVLFTMELARRLAGTPVTVNALHPGGVATAFARNNGLMRWLRHLVAHALRRDLISSRQGADTVVFLATHPDGATHSGKYFYRRRAVDSSPLSRDAALVRDLWVESIRLSQLDNSLETAWRYFDPLISETGFAANSGLFGGKPYSASI